jgi:gas vesicle protein
VDRTVKFFAGVLVGAVVGAAVVLVFAPQSGEDLRTGIRTRIDEIMEEGRQAAETKRLELTARLEELKQPQPRI